MDVKEAMTDSLDEILAGMVRDLQWYVPQHTGVTKAESALGLYRVWTYHESPNGAWYWHLASDIKHHSAGSEDEAKAAAEADYRSRIAAALNLEAITGMREARKDVGPSEIASEIWECLFNETKDCVPDELTDDLLSKVATSLLAGYSIVRRDP